MLMTSMMWNEIATASSSSNHRHQQVQMTGVPVKRKRDETEDLLPTAKLGPRRWLPSCSEAARLPDPWTLEDDSPPESDEDEDDDELILPPIEPRPAKPATPYPYHQQQTPQQIKPYFSELCVTDVAPYYRPEYCPPQNNQNRYNRQQYWSSQYCYPSESNQQQTIRCAENGKSYLELGSSPTTCRTSVYRQQRLAVLNISMCKLSRFRQFPDPSLHRSVLICNTLRRIEREMEHDSQFFCNEPSPISYPSPPSYPATPPPQDLPHYEHSLRDLASPAPRATPFPSPAHPSTDSDSSINWGSVLSLSSQSDLDPLNNNGSGISSLLDDLESDFSWRDDVLNKSVPDNRGEELVDSLMHVLVNT